MWQNVRQCCHDHLVCFEGEVSFRSFFISSPVYKVPHCTDTQNDVKASVVGFFCPLIAAHLQDEMEDGLSASRLHLPVGAVVAQHLQDAMVSMEGSLQDWLGGDVGVCSFAKI